MDRQLEPTPGWCERAYESISGMHRSMCYCSYGSEQQCRPCVVLRDYEAAQKSAEPTSERISVFDKIQEHVKESLAKRNELLDALIVETMWRTGKPFESLMLVENRCDDGRMEWAVEVKPEGWHHSEVKPASLPAKEELGHEYGEQSGRLCFICKHCEQQIHRDQKGFPCPARQPKAELSPLEKLLLHECAEEDKAAPLLELPKELADFFPEEAISYSPTNHKLKKVCVTLLFEMRKVAREEASSAFCDAARMAAKEFPSIADEQIKKHWLDIVGEGREIAREEIAAARIQASYGQVLGKREWGDQAQLRIVPKGDS